MTMNTVKRLVLGGLVALSVTGSSLAPVVAGHAAASSGGPGCDRNPFCQPPARS